ncbi:MAG: radical SAM protein [Cellulosilyticum sp.]|nr:radical SAM protein [Cellulosilyticum sp.]
MEFIPAKTLITRTKDRSWFGTRYNMNIYKGCSHGCIYCDSRSSCYQIEEFDRVRAKEDALAIIRKQLKGRIGAGVIGTGSMSDPYNPYEKTYQLTRGALELIDTYHFGVSIATKSYLIERDIDLLKKINRHSPTLVKVTITSCNDELSRLIEPNVCPSSRRFETLRKVADAGIFCGVLMMPILPFVEDTEENIIGIVNQAAECGVQFIYPAIGMTMRLGQREYFYQKLEEEFPGIKQKYEKQYGTSYYCTSPNVKRLWSIFTAECKKCGLLYKMPDIIAAYQSGFWQDQQLTLF